MLLKFQERTQSYYRLVRDDVKSFLERMKFVIYCIEKTVCFEGLRLLLIFSLLGLDR